MKLTPLRKQLLIFTVLLLALFTAKWVVERYWPPAPQTLEFKITEEQAWKLHLYEKSASWAEFERLRAIAEAESSWRQYDEEGNLLKGQDGKDWGIFQIRSSVHLEKAKEMGLDITTPEGNIDFAVYLHSQNGTEDWNASKYKWSKIVRGL